jgi:hypothetical protein
VKFDCSRGLVGDSPTLGDSPDVDLVVDSPHCDFATGFYPRGYRLAYAVAIFAWSAVVIGRLMPAMR